MRLSEEQEAFVAAIRNFAEREIVWKVRGDPHLGHGPGSDALDGADVLDEAGEHQRFFFFDAPFFPFLSFGRFGVDTASMNSTM